MIEKALSRLLLIGFLCVSPLTLSEVKVTTQPLSSEPHQVIQATTTKVLNALERGLDPIKEPEKFVAELSRILDPVVAFDYIARGVMGVYAKQASADQVKQFATAFKLGLVSTYGKGMASFSDLEVVVVPPSDSLEDARRVVVVQEIQGGSSTNQISYSMAKNRQGQWKMINVMLNGINLGETFRGQFAAAVEKNSGDLAKTINDWGKG